MRLHRTLPALLAAVVGLTVAAGLPSASASAWASASASAVPGSFVPLSAPARLLDTRTTVGGHHAAVKAHETVTLAVAEHGGVPASGAAAVALNVTATGATRSGYLTVYPAGQAQPAASNLNFAAATTVPNFAITKLGSAGQIKIYNGAAGTVNLVVDVSGYYRSGSAVDYGAFEPRGPQRVLDTRTATGGHHAVVKAHETVVLRLNQTGVSSVAMNVTVTSTLSSGVVTVYPSGAGRPTASNLNFVRGQTVANMVVVRVGDSTSVSFYNNSAGTVNLVADIAGYFRAGAPIRAGTLGTLSPTRLLDTRTSTGGHHAVVAAKGHVDLTVTGVGGVPWNGVSAVVLNVTATGGTRSGVITVYPTGASVPNASNLNYRPAQTVPNLVEARVGTGGKVTLFNNSTGTVNLVADVAGYYLSGDLALPRTTPGHYIRTVTSTSPDNALSSKGCADAKAITDAAPHTIVLDIGAQTNKKADGNPAGSPGVLFSGTGSRVTDAKLISLLKGYIGGFGKCRIATATGTVTLAIATNSDGSFDSGDEGYTGYSATLKGAEWARVVTALNVQPATNLTVVGADDIEPSFAATAAQATTWLNAYLANTKANFLFIGSAGGCPVPLGQTHQTCRVEDNLDNPFEQTDLYALAHGLEPTRITALPQIYDADQAAQWANIDRTGATSTDQINFVGALTEHQADPSGSVEPAQGWALLKQALSTTKNTAGSTLGVVVDLNVI